jgi:outer membrane protein assembly factor BamB
MMAPMRKLVPAIAALLVLAGSLAAYAFYRLHQSRDHRGSATVEFVPTEVPRQARASGKIIWRTFGYDAERLHVGPRTALRPPFRRVWVAGGASLLEFPPAIAFHRLYLANGEGDVLAYSVKTGAQAWRYRTGHCTAASPAIGRYHHGTLYETFLAPRPCTGGETHGGLVVAIATGDGKLRWRRSIGASESSPLLIGTHLYLGDSLGTIWCFRAGTGRLVWKFHAGGAVKGALAEYRGRLYVGAYDGHVYALNARTGKLVWRASGDPRFLGGHGTFYSTPAVAYGRVYIGSTDGKVYSFGAESGKRRWSFSTGGYVYGSPAVWRRRVYVGSYNHTFYALDAATGSKLWSFRASAPISGSATVIDGIVYFASFDKHTYALDARTGKLLWTFPDGRYTPVVTDGKKLYLLGYAKVYALAPRRR